MSAAHADRNLLFGVLALQMDFISRDALIAALNSWVLEKSRSLGQIMVDQSVLSNADRAMLEAVVERHLQLHEGDIEKSIASLASLRDFDRELQQIADVDVQASLQQFSVARSGEVDLGSTVSFSAGRTTSEGNRFHILRPHAHGGLGEVHVARDDELNREVALKEIKRTLDDSPDRQARFIREAEITGRLEHPGVVPVYGMGKYADGRPYYAMRFVKGESLKEAIERFHTAAHRNVTVRMLGLRNLLNRLIDVCNTIEYAHSRGVLHRDLKPSNIMLGKYGETLVVDWGLAKALGERDTEADETELTLIPSSGSGSSETVAGSAIGTPAYMSPEQAEGRIEKISVASDVYSLGATLYTLLTGKEPFTAQNVGAVLAKVQNGEFVPPRDCSRSVPPPLNAICLKAMSLRPADRYESCAALASDIEHWLADEPVSAFREPWTVSSARWIKRHRGLAAGSAVLLAALVVGLVVGTVILGRANSRILAANAQIADEAKRADNQRALAEQREAEATKQLYVSQMNLAQRAWDEKNVGRARELLNSLMPEHTAGVDLRGWEWHYLWRLTHSELRILQFMSMCLAFTPDGQFLISGSDDGTLKAWNASGTREMWSVQAHSDRVTRLAVSTDGDLIATRGRNGDAKLWESTSGREIRIYPSSPGKGRGMTLSRNGDRLVTATEDIIIWDTPTGREVLLLKGHTRQVDGLAFFPDGQRLASCSDDGTARVWDAKTGQELRTLFRQNTQVKTVAVSPDGRSVATGDFVGAIRCWDGETGQELPQFAGHPHKVTALAYSHDGKRLASTSSDTTLKLWDSETGRETQTIRGHESNISDVALAPSGDIIASGSWDGTIRLWDAASRQEPWWHSHPCGVLSVAYSPDSSLLAVGGYGTVTVFDASTGLILWSEPEFLPTGNATSAGSLRFDPHSQILALALYTGDLRLRDARMGGIIRTIKAHDGQANCVDYSPDGRVLATGGADRQVALWSAEDGHQLATLSGHTDMVMSVVFSPNGKVVASAGSENDRRLILWDVASGREVRSFIGHEGSVLCGLFSRDGSQVFTGSRDEMIRMWDVDSGQTIRVHRGHAGSVKCLSISPDGRRLVSCSDDQTVRVWDIGTGQEVQTLTAEAGPLWSVDLSPDGTRLATGSLSGRVVVWDARPLTDELRDELTSPDLLARIAAEELVQSLFASLLLQADVIEAINADTTISEAVRTKALDLARNWSVNANDLNDRSWSIVTQPGRTVDEYQLAVRYMESACEVAPDNGYLLNTLGIAEYRVGDYENAAQTLSRSDVLNIPAYGGSIPADVAFLVMAHRQLGHADEAAQYLKQLRQLLETDEWKGDAESQAFLKEAEELAPPVTPAPAELPQPTLP